jgi:hypothetical protein
VIDFSDLFFYAENQIPRHFHGEKCRKIPLNVIFRRKEMSEKRTPGANPTNSGENPTTSEFTTTTPALYMLVRAFLKRGK